ncbi:MAG: DUF1963 domain-containing protein [Oscillospiraceae bacterium]|jgi:uncharacterized protein YwqG|nr:DUF1963 domain-containing protein [Oscillospiraceae bacterium]
MNRIGIKKRQPGSKFFGNPDVWDSFVWPEVKDDDGNEYHLDFVCQIVCTEVSKHDADGLLPKTGMLYFFYDLANQYTHKCAVLYYDGDPGALTPFVLTDDEGKEVALPPVLIEFIGDDDPYEGDLEDSFLLGAPSDPEQMGLGDSVPEDWQLLLEVDSYVGDYDFNFGGDCGMLCFFITKQDLAKKDFSEVWTDMAVY